MTYPLATSTWGEEEVSAVQRVLHSGRTTMGPLVEECERSLAAFTGARHCVMVNSGSSANLLAVAALCFRKEKPLQRGDEVIVPAVSWPTTYYPLAQYGLKLKFVDISLETLNYDLDALSQAVSSRTRMIVAVNLLGNCNDFSRIQEIIAGKEITLMEDNCESLGASFQGRQAGTFGLMGTYSSFFSHHISTMEGGFITTDDEELHHILLCLRAHGWTRNLPKFNHVVGVKGDDPFEESFRFVLPGYNVRPLEMSGALGIEQIRKLPEFVRIRRENAKRFQKMFSDHPHFLIQREVGESSWFGFSLIIRPEARIARKEIVARLEEHGVECRPIVAGNFAKNPVLSRFEHEISGSLANAEWIDKNGLFVGNHHYPLDKELELLRRALP